MEQGIISAEQGILAQEQGFLPFKTEIIAGWGFRYTQEMLRRLPQSDVELMTKKEVLDFKPVPRLKQVGDIRPKQVDDHKHRIRWCADSVLPRESGRMEFSGITSPISRLETFH
jgi:hypothetical protein